MASCFVMVGIWTGAGHKKPSWVLWPRRSVASGGLIFTLLRQWLLLPSFTSDPLVIRTPLPVCQASTKYWKLTSGWCWRAGLFHKLVDLFILSSLFLCQKLKEWSIHQIDCPLICWRVHALTLVSWFVYFQAEIKQTSWCTVFISCICCWSVICVSCFSDPRTFVAAGNQPPAQTSILTFHLTTPTCDPSDLLGNEPNLPLAISPLSYNARAGLIRVCLLSQWKSRMDKMADQFLKMICCEFAYH